MSISSNITEEHTYREKEGTIRVLLNYQKFILNVRVKGIPLCLRCRRLPDALRLEHSLNTIHRSELLHTVTTENFIKRGERVLIFTESLKDRLTLLLVDDQEEILALVPSPDVRVYVGRVLAPEAAIRAAEFRLPAAGSAQMGVQRSFVLVPLRTVRANVVPGLHHVHHVPVLHAERGVHEAALGDVPFQVALGRVGAVAEAASELSDPVVWEWDCNTQATPDLQTSVGPSNHSKWSTRFHWPFGHGLEGARDRIVN